MQEATKREGDVRRDNVPTEEPRREYIQRSYWYNLRHEMVSHFARARELDTVGQLSVVSQSRSMDCSNLYLEFVDKPHVAFNSALAYLSRRHARPGWCLMIADAVVCSLANI